MHKRKQSEMEDWSAVHMDDGAGLPTSVYIEFVYVLILCVCMCLIIYSFVIYFNNYIRKWVLWILFYKNRYIFRNINAIGFLFLTQHTTPLLYVKIHFGVLHVRSTDVTRSDTLYGSKRPHLQVGVSKSVQNRYLCRRVLPLLICSAR